MNYIKVTYPVGSSFIKSTFEDNSSYIRTSVNSTFIKVSYDGGSSGLDAERLRTKVYNVTGATLTKGTVVYINGTHGNLPSVTKAIATGDATSAQTLGLVMEDIVDNKSGYIIIAGKLSDLDTQAFANGAQLYLSSTVAGTYTTTKQYAPAHLVYVGIINRSHPTQGEIEVKIQNGYEADEIHDFAVRNPLNNQGIFFNSTTSLWEKKYVSDALGYTPANASTTLTINGVTFDLSQNRSWTIAAGISGSGTSGQVSYWTGASSLGGSNNLFWDAANSRLGIGTNSPEAGKFIDVVFNEPNLGGRGVRIRNTNTTGYSELVFDNNRTPTGSGSFVFGLGGQTSIGAPDSAYFFLRLNANLLFGTNNLERARFTGSGNLLLNTTSDDGINRLQVTGSAKFTSDILVNGINIGLGAGNVASNLRFGGSALLSNTTGAGNVALGYAAMYYNTGGSNNMAIGVQSLVGNSTGDNNVAVGSAALFNNTNGYNNVAIGYWAGRDSIGSASNTVGANNIFIGYSCVGESGIESNRTWIGNASTTSTWLGGNLLLGTRTNGTERLQVVGNVNFGGATGLTWDDTNKRLGIGTNAPASTLHLRQTSTAADNVLTMTSNATNANMLLFRNPDNSVQGLLYGIGSSVSYGTYIPNQINIISGVGGIALRTNNAAPIRFYATNSNPDFSTIQLQMFANTGNLVLQNGGTFTDGGQRLQVIGDTLLRGSGATSATTALTVQNSASTDLFVVRNDGSGFLKRAGNSSGFYIDTNGEFIRGGASGNISLGFGSGSFRGFFQFAQNHDNGNGDNWYFGYSTSSLSNTSTTGTNNFIGIQGNFRPTSGTASYSQLTIYPTINQTGGANGVTRGFYINPTLTAAADWRSIQWDNNTGWGIYGAGTADNYLAGDLSIGTLTTTDWINIGASTTAKAHIFLTAGVDPTSPANGDIWFDGTNLKMRVGGVTRTFTLV